MLYDVKPVKVSLASPHPATSLSVRGDGTRLAVGNVEGTVLVYRLPGFAKVSFRVFVREAGMRFRGLLSVVSHGKWREVKGRVSWLAKYSFF